jgi:hypothetical protein
MDMKIQFDASAVLQALERAPTTTVEEIRRALLESCRLVQQKAREKHRFRTKTGMLERSIDYQVDEGKCEGVIQINPTIAPYGKYVHTGTRPHDIVPKDKHSLRWAGPGNKFIFAKRVHHPGTQKDEFLYEAAEQSRVEINAIFARHIDKATKEAGL